MDQRFVGKTVIVTGAGSGIGRAVAQRLGAEGAAVGCLDVNEAQARATADGLQALGASAIAQRCDVTSYEDVVGSVEAATAALGPVDVACNVAGIGWFAYSHEEDPARFARVIAVNLTGTFHAARAVAPAMKRGRYGRIVNISSGAGRSVSLTGIQAYASAKAGQLGLTRQLAHELGPWGITVNAVAPGFVLSNPATERQWESYGPEGQRALVDGIALRRLGEPEDIAHGVLFFASDYARWCTGQALSIDGGVAMF